MGGLPRGAVSPADLIISELCFDTLKVCQIHPLGNGFHCQKSVLRMVAIITPLAIHDALYTVRGTLFAPYSTTVDGVPKSHEGSPDHPIGLLTRITPTAQHTPFSESKA